METIATKDDEKIVKVLPDLEAISKFAADKFVALANKTVASRGRFAVALAGGSTPKPMYELLATDKYSSKLDWKKVYFFFGDERNVLPHSDQSNFKMVNDTLFSKVSVPEDNIKRWPTEILNPSKIAASYNQTIVDFFELSDSDFPRFDLVLLGMGDDGHTASLFPFTDALKENNKSAVPNFVKAFDTNRLTLTYPAINNARNIIFLVSGKNKAPAVKEVLKGAKNFEKFPAQYIKPKNGRLFWLIDNEAAGNLSV